MISDIESGAEAQDSVLLLLPKISYQDSVMNQQRTRIERMRSDLEDLAEDKERLLSENHKDNENLQRSRRENTWLKVGIGVLSVVVFLLK